MEHGDADDGGRDLARAIAELAERLPAPLAPLARVAYNYAWTWQPDAARVFAAIDETTWRREHNPRYLIEVAPPHGLQALARDSAYVARVQAVHAALDADLARAADPGPFSAERPVVYFCAEFGVHGSVPIYGGGLGILAGDLLKAASDLAVPMVGIGLAYRQGYFHQRLDTAGWQHEYWVDCAFDRLPAVRVSQADGQALTIRVRIRGRDVQAQMWRLDVGRTRLYLLDTDCEGNGAIDRWITSRLYVGDRQTRLAQYAMLGIGGVRALAALGIRPGLVHLNEGHAALGGLERVRRLIATGTPSEAAFAEVRRETVFTTHTPVAAGNESYGEAEIDAVLGEFLGTVGVPAAVLHDLGRVDPGRADEPIGLTPLALRTSRAANGVSQLHGEVACTMWQGLWREGDDHVPIGHVTNGVHVGTWMAEPMQHLLDRHLGPGWRSWSGDDERWDGLEAVSDAELWQVRCSLRQALVDYARDQSVRDRLARGEAPEYVEQAAQVFDPQVLTIGFARRVATYKRLYLLSRFPERNLRLLAETSMPVQIVVAGKAHPQDQDAKNTLHEIFAVKGAPNVGRRVVYLEDYDLTMAPRIVSGVDLWLNFPRPPLEASGTSGMKVAMNGGLNLSVLDGWWAEAFDGGNGWAIDSADGDANVQDDRDATAVLDVIENEVRPLFYDRRPDGLPERWVRKMKYAMRTLIPHFTAERMLRDYRTEMYTPDTHRVSR